MPLIGLVMMKSGLKLHLCLRGSLYSRPSIISKRGGFVIQRHNELRNLDAELVSTVCSNVEGHPVLQDISREQRS